MRSLHGKNIELETQLQLESRAKRWALHPPHHVYHALLSTLMFHAYQNNRSQEDSNKKLLLDLENSNLANKELREKIEVGRHFQGLEACGL